MRSTSPTFAAGGLAEKIAGWYNDSMSSAVNRRDVLLCLLAKQRGLLDDVRLEGAVVQWRAAPNLSLLDVLEQRGEINAQQRAELDAAVASHADDAAVDPQSSRLRELPPGVRHLLVGGAASDVALATEVGFDTRPASTASPPSPTAVAASSTPGERFDVLQVHAQGGLGVVFLARDHEIERTVALKQIKSQWADDEDSRTRFLLEARITGRLEHPGIVPIYALGADATGRPYYAMRLIRGESLLEVLNRFHATAVAGKLSQRLPELRKLLQRFVDVCNAVDYAHSKGVIHRDLKPSNIMVGKYGETLVVDWGLAKVIGSDEDVALTTRMVRQPETEGGGTSTRIGTTIGTPAYMSPEQAAGKNDELGPPTDVYSLGATLYQLLTGELPHVEDDDMGVMIARAEHGNVIPVLTAAPWLPRPLASIVMKALALAPEARYVSARALADDIERWLGDEPVRAHRESYGEQIYRWSRNHRTLATSLFVGYLVATVAIIIGSFGWSYLRVQHEERRQRTTSAETAANEGSASAPATPE
jgi:serine/threonine protein kinase